MAYIEYVAFCPHCDISISLKGMFHAGERDFGHCRICKKKFTLFFRKFVRKQVKIANFTAV